MENGQTCRVMQSVENGKYDTLLFQIMHPFTFLWSSMILFFDGHSTNRSFEWSNKTAHTSTRTMGNRPVGPLRYGLNESMELEVILCELLFLPTLR